MKISITRKQIIFPENIKISGTFLTKVFEGPYKDAGKWYKEIKKMAEEKGIPNNKIYFYYTTCPKCAKKWGKNYVVGFLQIN
jgi:effector-binding domain-containing protein